MARILLLDDDDVFSDLLGEELQQLGHQVVCRASAEEGLGLLSSGEPFDLVLLDNIMPRLSGLEFLPALQQRGVWVPVVLMTSAHSDKTVIQAINLGAFD